MSGVVVSRTPGRRFGKTAAAAAVSNPFPVGSTASTAWQRGFGVGVQGQIVKPPYATKGPRQAFIDGWMAGIAAMKARASQRAVRHDDL